MSRLAVPQARVRRVIGTCYAIWEGTACRIWPQPAVAATRATGESLSPTVRQNTRGERAAQASLPFRPEGQRNRMRVATAVSPFVGFERSPRLAAQGRWEVRLSCGWLPLRFRRVCRTSRSPAVGRRLPNKQLPEFWSWRRRGRKPFFSSVCMRFRLLLQKAIHARRGFWGDVFECVFAGPNGGSLELSLKDFENCV